MANVNKVNGFKPIRYQGGAPYTGAFNRYVVGATDTTALFVGDLVKLDGLGDGVTGLTTVTAAAATNQVIGAIVGFEISPTALDTPQYRVASTRRVVFVADDPELLFVAQEDGAVDPLEAIDCGSNVDIVVAAGSTVTGASGMQIDSSTEATSSTHALKLIETYQVSDNEIVSGGQAYTRWVVKINAHQRADFSTGV